MTKSMNSSPSPSNLWHNRAFIRLWLAQILSRAGTEITNVALPLTAVLILNATPAQMGLLGVVGSLPNLLFGLLAGVWVDRKRRSPMLVGADLGRAILLGSIPIAALLGNLTFGHILLVVFAAATLSIFFTLASVSILPAIMPAEQLVEANSKLALSDSIIGIAGPGVAGGLVQLVSAPKAIIVDAVSYLCSALSLRGIAALEAPIHSPVRRVTIWREIREGWDELARTPLLRALTIAAGIGSLGGGIAQPILMLFLVRSLEFSPTVIGLAFTCNSIGSLLGSILAGRTAGRLGIGPAIIGGTCLWLLGNLLIPLAGWLPGPPLLVVGLGQFLSGIGATIFSINQMSLRQHLTPVGLFARATATRRFLIFGLAAVGAAAGGFLGDTTGLRLTLLIGAIVFGAGCLFLFLSPVGHIRALSQTNDPR